ncbi:MAG TPA: IS3 family transposase, partial [Candidatus Latescibacteria bacterium]|nr:IS3 family transposase [Candidatus Latescibacterota bacterium]
MGITRPPYPAEFKQQIIELYRSGRTPGQLAKEFEHREATTHIDHSGRRRIRPATDVLTSTLRDELRCTGVK